MPDSTGSALPGDRSLLAQGFAVRGLVEAHRVLEEERYLQAARATYGFMNQELWDEGVGVYRSAVNAQVSEYTPMTIGAAIGVMREMILANEDPGEIERFKRFWVQAVNSTALQQAEYEENGEKDFFQADGDGDGIPRMEYGDGKHGIAPVFASLIRIQTPKTR